MSKQVFNYRMANRRLVIIGETVTFDGNGNARVSDEVAEELLKLSGYSTLDNPEVPEPVPEPAPDTKADEPKPEHEPEVEPEVAEPKAEPEPEAAEPAEEESAKEVLEAELEGMNVPQLRKYAKEHGIELDGATKKVDILAAIKDAQ